MASSLHISPGKRHILDENGKPFFYLGDTAWQLFHSLSFEDAAHYLKTRAAQKFTVIQAVALSEFDGLRTPNVYGHVPFIGLDPTRPNEDYFRHIDRVMQFGADQGLWWGLLPTWGDKWNNSQWGEGPEVFTPENARIYGEWLGKRYRGMPVIWMLGGDRSILNGRHMEIIRSLVGGLKDGDGGSHLKTFHISGGRSSSEQVHDEAWLDFNTLQSGHQSSRLHNHLMIAADYRRNPARPCLDSEPPYENHPDIAFGWNCPAPYFDDLIVRRAAWQSLFAGACGHTYGCHDIWQFHDGIRPAHNRARTPWKESLHLPGALQMRHLRGFFESLPFESLVPDDHLASVMPSGESVLALRSEDKRTALFYFPSPGIRSLKLTALEGSLFDGYWFDPRTGSRRNMEPLPSAPIYECTPPSEGTDWVLVLQACLFPETKV